MVALATGPKVETPVPLQTQGIRRFAEADLMKHGQWIMKRLFKEYPNQTDRSLIGWLKNLLFDNASWFMYQDNSVALFQVTSAFSLAHKPMVIERFVFAKQNFETEALEFYVEVEKWAKSMSVNEIIVEQLSDVPHDMIKNKLGRLFTKQQVIMRV